MRKCTNKAIEVQGLLSKSEIKSTRNNYVIIIPLDNARVINGKPFDALSVSISPDRTGNFDEENPSVMEGLLRYENDLLSEEYFQMRHFEKPSDIVELFKYLNTLPKYLNTLPKLSFFGKVYNRILSFWSKRYQN